MKSDCDNGQEKAVLSQNKGANTFLLQTYLSKSKLQKYANNKIE